MIVVRFLFKGDVRLALIESTSRTDMMGKTTGSAVGAFGWVVTIKFVVLSGPTETLSGGAGFLFGYCHSLLQALSTVRIIEIIEKRGLCKLFMIPFTFFMVL